MSVIVVDIGSSYIKSALIDMENASIVKENILLAPQKRQSDVVGAYEIQADIFMSMIYEIISDYHMLEATIEALFISTQMHGFVYSDESTPYTYISWQDSRCLNMYSGKNKTYLEYISEILPEDYSKISGVRPKPSLGMCNLFALLDERKEASEKKLFTLGSYIIWCLTGNNRCHITNAAPLGLVDLKTKDWNYELLSTLGFKSIGLPQIVSDDYEACGDYRNGNSSIKVYPDYGDQQVCVLGNCPRDGEGIINIATAGQVCCISYEKASGRFENRPYFSGGILRTISNMPAGRNLNVVVDFIREAVSSVTGIQVNSSAVWKAIENTSNGETDNLAVDTAFFAVNGADNGGYIRGIGGENLTLKNLFNAAYMDMAQKYASQIDELSKYSRIEGLLCCGGVSNKSNKLIRAIEQTTQLPCRISQKHDEAFVGLYRIARCALGMDKSLNCQIKTMVVLKHSLTKLGDAQ